MLALVNGQYKFRWVDVGTAGSCSDAQIFNACQLKRKIGDGRIGFSDPVPVTQGGSDVSYFILAEDAFALKTWLMKPYGRRMLTREERIANYRISRGRNVENTFGILVSRFRVMLSTIEVPPETVREEVFTCVVLHNILRSQYQGQLMKPYGRRMLTREERIANYRISRGRRVVENAFGILVSRFRVMLTTIEVPQKQ